MWSINVILRLLKAADFVVVAVVVVLNVVGLAIFVVTGHIIFGCGKNV